MIVVNNLQIVSHLQQFISLSGAVSYHRLVSLTISWGFTADRGLTGNSSLYQSVYIYDLRTKRYERKVPGVYIIPSQPHEFKLLTNDLLMGLSENRNQIFIWNLQTGSPSSSSPAPYN